MRAPPYRLRCRRLGHRRDGIVKLSRIGLTDPQHARFTTGQQDSSPTSWGSATRVLVNLTVPSSGSARPAAPPPAATCDNTGAPTPVQPRWCRFGPRARTGISDLPPADGPFIHPKAAQRTTLLFVTASSRFRGRQLSEHCADPRHREERRHAGARPGVGRRADPRRPDREGADPAG